MSDAEDAVFDDWEAAEDAGEFDENVQDAPVVDPHSAEGIERAKQLAIDPSLQWKEEDGLAADFKPQMQLRLMKRPQGKTEPTPVNQSEKPLSDKDIQRREREYAKARAEILGSKGPTSSGLAKRK
eukprot:m.25850 g.25850  ORF g.25850 m.25850 type:complete len:126 (-) comp11633_c0_seq2:571-948(-)